jgi:hypothetical protein
VCVCAVMYVRITYTLFVPGDISAPSYDRLNTPTRAIYSVLGGLSQRFEI